MVPHSCGLHLSVAESQKCVFARCYSRFTHLFLASPVYTMLCSYITKLWSCRDFTTKLFLLFSQLQTCWPKRIATIGCVQMSRERDTKLRARLSWVMDFGRDIVGIVAGQESSRWVICEIFHSLSSFKGVMTCLFIILVSSSRFTYDAGKVLHKKKSFICKYDVCWPRF